MATDTHNTNSGTTKDRKFVFVLINDKTAQEDCGPVAPPRRRQKNLQHSPNSGRPDLVTSVPPTTGVSSYLASVIIIADHLLDVGQFSLQIFTPALLHLIICGLWE